MKQLSPKALATVVAKQSSGVSVRLGKTNGQPVLHLIRRQRGATEAASLTIPATQTDWDLHPWNHNNAPKKAKKKDKDKEAATDA